MLTQWRWRKQNVHRAIEQSGYRTFHSKHNHCFDYEIADWHARNFFGSHWNQYSYWKNSLPIDSDQLVAM